jgi:hypothetical protein
MPISVGVAEWVPARTYPLIASSSAGTARQIVGQDAQRRLGGDLGKRLHQEVSCAHAHLHGAERMVDAATSSTMLSAVRGGG